MIAKPLIIRAALIVGFSAALWAQHSGGGGGTPVRLPTPTSTPFPTTTTPNTTELPRPLYVAGKVIMEDGTPPPEAVPIQVVCGGTPRSIGFSDSKGRFDLDLNDRKNSAIYSDASQAGTNPAGAGGSFGTLARQQAGSGGLAPSRAYSGCDLQAALAGFRSDRVSLTGHRTLEDPQVGTIVLHRVANVQGLTISATSAFAPKDAKRAFEKALNQEQKGRWPDAERELEKAVTLYPKYAAAWFHLGFTKQEQNNLDGARESYAKALAADPHYLSPYQELAFLAARQQKWTEVAENTDRLLSLNPIDFPDAWMYNAMANIQLHNMEAAEKSARQGLATDAGHRYPKLDQILGIILVQRQAYPEAAEHMREYLRLAPAAADSSLVKTQLADIERRLPAAVTAKSPAAPK